MLEVEPSVIDADDLTRCRELHVRAQRGWLPADDAPEYAQLVDRLFAEAAARAVDPRGAAQQRRRELRIRRALQVELAWVGGETRGLTRDVGVGGFSAMVGEKPPGPGEVVVARLSLPRGATVVAPVRVAAVAERRGSVRVCVAFEELEPAEAVRLRATLLEDALSLAAIDRDGMVAAPAKAG